VEQFLLSKLANSGPEQLAKVVDELPRKLLVFLTHHHYDHIDGMDSLKLINTK
jgi:phosphoribosyl 1,2-cyclic phosphodiesterase